MFAVLSHCWGRGWEVILGDKSHLILFEQGGMSQVQHLLYKTDSTRLELAYCIKLVYSACMFLTK